MNEQLRLNGEMIRAHLEAQARDVYPFLVKNLSVSTATVGRMLNEGHVPKLRTLKKLAALLGVKESDLLLPREPEAKRAS